jgi:Domain of unknown function (DUF4340)
MLWKKTVVMMAAFAVATLGAILVVAVPSGGQGPQLTLPSVDSESVTKLEIFEGEATITLTKSGDDWTLSPEGYPADSRRVKAGLDALAAVSAGTMTSKSPKMHSKYEVTEDKLTVAASSDSGELIKLIVGKETADKRGNYVRKPGDDRVFASAGRVQSTFRSDLDFWRDKTIFSFVKDDATELKLTTGNQAFEFVKNDEGQWSFKVAPEGLPADYRLDPEKVDRIVRAISTLRAASFVDDNETTSKAGFDSPAAKVTVAFSEIDPVTLIVGAEEETNAYVKRADNDQIWMIPNHQSKQLTLNAQGLQDLHVAAFDKSKAVKAEVVIGTNRTVLEKQEGAWKLAETNESVDGEFVLDTVKVDGMISNAARFQGKELLGKSAPADSGLSSPTGVLTVTLDDGASRVFRIGAETGDKEIYVQGGGRVYIAAKASAERLLRTLADYKVAAKKQQPMFSPEQLKNLPPQLQQQLLQQQKQKIMQNQMLQQVMKKSGKDKSGK